MGVTNSPPVSALFRIKPVCMITVVWLFSWISTSVFAGTISGTIFNVSGQPLAGAPVFVGVLSGDPCGQISWVGSSPIDGNGNYSIENVQAGMYYLRIWNNNTYYVEEWYAGSESDRNCQNALPVTVTDNGTEPEKNFQLEEGGKISGTIFGPNNQPLTGAPLGVNVFSGDPCGNHFNVAWTGPITNDGTDDGNYTLSGIPAGTYYLKSWNNGTNYIEEWSAGNDSDTDCHNAQQVTVVAGQTETGKNFHLEEGGTITGTIYGPNDQPLIGVPLGVNVLSGDPCDNTPWVAGAGNINNDGNDDGNYTINGIPAGTYYLRIERNDTNYIEEWYAGSASDRDCHNAQKVTVVAGQVESGKNFQLEEGGTITGTIYGPNNQPLIGVPLGVNVLAGDPCDNNSWVAASGIINNDGIDDGNYTINGIPPGTYYLRVWSNNTNYIEEWYAGNDSDRDCHDAQQVTVVAGQTENGKNFNLEEGGSVNGTIYGPDNMPLIGVPIRVDILSGDPCGNNSGVAGTGDINDDGTDDGNYSLNGIPAGSYYLRIGRNDTNYIEEWYAGSSSDGDCHNAQQVTVVAGQTENGKNFQLEEGGTITGTIYGPNNQPLTGVPVHVNVQSGDPCGQFSWVAGSGDINNDGNDDGKYTVGGIPDGTYYLLIWSNNTNYIEEWYAGSSSDRNCQNAQSVTVVGGQVTSNKNFQLEEGGRVSGFVYEENGSTLLSGESSNVRVNAYTGDPCQWNYANGGNVSTVDGSYITDILPQGTVYLHVDNLEVHQHGWWTTSGMVLDEDCSQASPITVTAGTTNANKNFSVPRDTDGDGLNDSQETNIYHTDPTNWDSDGDGLPDDAEVSIWEGDYNGDIDNDGVWNILETDADGDGVSDVQEMARGSLMKDPASTAPALTLYEDFSSGNLAKEKWSPEQYEMVTGNGALHLFVDSPAAYRQTAETPATAAQNIKATFTVDDVVSNAGGSASFDIHGVYYHENADPASQIGRVYASMSLFKSGAGLQAMYYIGRKTDESGGMALVKSNVIATPALSVGTVYKMEIRYDGSNGFTFNLYNAAGGVLGTASDTGNPFGSVLSDLRGLAVSTLENGGRMAVSVDSFETAEGAGAYTVYDSFEATPSSPLDSTRWETPEAAKRLTNDKRLHLLSHSYGDRRTIRAKMAHRYNYIQAKVKIDSTESFVTGSARGRIRITANLYNDSHGPNSGSPYNGYEGDVSAQITIDYTESQGLYATAYAERVNNADWTSSEAIFYDRFDMPLAFDTEYIIYIGFAGDFILAGLDSVDGTQHEVTGDQISSSQRYLPFEPDMQISSRVDGNGAEGLMSAYVDDVQVSGSPLEIPGDVNVDGNVDLADAVVGLQTVSGMNTGTSWSAGDIDGDGRIGLQDVIAILRQVSSF